MSWNSFEYSSMSIVSHEHSWRWKSLARSFNGFRWVFKKSSTSSSDETNQTTTKTSHCIGINRRSTSTNCSNEQFKTTKEINDGQMKKEKKERQIFSHIYFFFSSFELDDNHFDKCENRKTKRHWPFLLFFFFFFVIL